MQSKNTEYRGSGFFTKSKYREMLSWMLSLLKRTSPRLSHLCVINSIRQGNLNTVSMEVFSTINDEAKNKILLSHIYKDIENLLIIEKFVDIAFSTKATLLLNSIELLDERNTNYISDIALLYFKIDQFMTSFALFPPTVTT
jgi:hypothetical protein